LIFFFRLIFDELFNLGKKMETTFFLIIFEGVVNIGDKIIFFMSDADPGCVTTISGTKSVVLSF